MLRLSQIRILLLLVLSHQLVRAVSSSAAASGPQQEEPNSDNRPRRTLFNIVVGCASTIIISAWRSVHPNIPPRASYLRRIFRKLNLLLCTLIAPEILPLWALKQWIGAVQVRDIYNRRGSEAPNLKKVDLSISAWIKGAIRSLIVSICIWNDDDREKWFSLHEIVQPDDHREDWTSTHGHYLVMGGFRLIDLVDNDERGKSPSLSSPKSIKAQRKISSADGSQYSPTTQRMAKDPEKGLESPEDMGRRERERGTILTPEMLKKLIETSDFRIRVTEREIEDRSRADVVSKFIFVLQTWWFITQCIARGVQGLELTQLELTTVAFASLNAITFVLWMKKPLGAQVSMRVYMEERLTDEERNSDRDASKESILSALPKYIHSSFEKGLRFLDVRKRRPSTFFSWLIVLPILVLAFVLSPIIIIISAITFTFYDVMFTSSSFPPDDSHVPPFYTPRPKSAWQYPIILSLLCMAVGGIHCAGWNLTFPTVTQRILWRAASLAVTAIPFLCLLVSTILKSTTSQKSPRVVMFVISVVAYVAARVFLVAQALALLKDQPPSAFLDVDWTKFVPHA